MTTINRTCALALTASLALVGTALGTTKAPPDVPKGPPETPVVTPPAPNPPPDVTPTVSPDVEALPTPAPVPAIPEIVPQVTTPPPPAVIRLPRLRTRTTCRDVPPQAGMAWFNGSRLGFRCPLPHSRRPRPRVVGVTG